MFDLQFILHLFQLFMLIPFCGCNPNFIPNLAAFKRDLDMNVYGQHLVQDSVPQELAKFLQTPIPKRPLVLSFHGPSGTGKTMVSSMLANHLHGPTSRPCVHLFHPTLHLSSPDQVKGSRKELEGWVQENLTTCVLPIFIFEDMETMPPNVIDALVPFLDPYHHMYDTNYSKAIYIFISTTGDDVINKLSVENQRAGQDREEIELAVLQDVIAHASYTEDRNGFFQSSIIQKKLVTCFVPFLPLNRQHVELCARSELYQMGHRKRNDVVAAVGGNMTYFPVREQYFSISGCKLVSAKIYSSL